MTSGTIVDLTVPSITSDEALRIARQDAERVYRDLVDLRHPVAADPDLLVEEDTDPLLLEEGAKPLCELLVRGDVPVAEEDLAHSSTKNCSMVREASAGRGGSARGGWRSSSGRNLAVGGCREKRSCAAFGADDGREKL